MISIKYWAIKVFWIFANPVRKAYWFIARPKIRGVKSIVLYDNKFLLVKLNYAHGLWTFPGGKVNTKESYTEAAQREVLEETGVSMLNPLFVGSYTSNKNFKNDIVEIYMGNSNTMNTKIDPVEIKEVGWFNKDDIPKNHTPSVDRILKIYENI